MLGVVVSIIVTTFVPVNPEFLLCFFASSSLLGYRFVLDSVKIRLVRAGKDPLLFYIDDSVSIVNPSEVKASINLPSAAMILSSSLKPIQQLYSCQQETKTIKSSAP